MTKKNRIVFAIMIVLVIAVAAGTIIFINSKKKTNKTEDTKETMTTENEDEKIEENLGDTSDETTEESTDEIEMVDEPVDVEGPEEEEQASNSQKPSVPKVEAIPGQYRDPNNIVVVIDPGHQRKGDSTKEPNGPGSTTMKARVTSGTTGVSTRIAEYIMNLEVSLKLRTELENRGYTVCMTRTTHDVSISNKERAEYANSMKADITVRIHGNGSTDGSVHGAEAYAPSANNAYVSHLSKASISLSQCILDEYCKATGFKNRGVFGSDTMTGINWCEMPVTIIELGYMSNAEEDVKLNDETMQNNMVQGIANGIDKYFGF